MKSTNLPPELAELRDQIKGYAEGFGLDCFETIFEMVPSDAINSLAAQEGFPVRYPHWRFGMNYDQYSKGYEWGLQKIYEMVINTNPSYAYLMTANSFVDQKTVMAHVYGHVDFFKNNYWFSKTNRKMLDTMANHAVRVRRYMDEYGQDEVENFIDICLSLDNLIDPHLPFHEAKQPKTESEKTASRQNDGRMKVDRQYMDKYINPPEYLEEQKQKRAAANKQEKKFPSHPERDVMFFLMTHGPLQDWQRDVLRMIRDESYYFLPQMQTKIMNEGWASYWHSEIMTKKALRDSEIIDFADHHAGVLTMQPGRINPYKIGIELFRDIEDRWNKGRFGKEYEDCTNLQERAKWDKKLGHGRQKIFEVRKVCNDVTFIDEYITPDFIDRHKLYTYEFNKRTGQYEIVDRNFKSVKEKLLSSLTNQGHPNISIVDGNFENRGELYLFHRYLGVDLDLKYARETMRSIYTIWTRPVHIETEVDGRKRIFTYTAKHEFIAKD
ncbi:MAG: SpoVR family protein [Bdellovibrionales bacterium]|nr:SpoVR family protein [Bdellovibrionales bacterium]